MTASAALSCLAALPADASTGVDRGACLSTARVLKLSAAQIDQMVAGFGAEAQLFPPAQCGANLYRMTYQTIAPGGAPAVASAGVVLPTACTPPYSLVEYNHGTWTTSGLTMSQPKVHTVQEVMGQFAAQGYVAVMPDYLGYGASTLDYHPYMHAASNADVTMDAVRGVRNCLQGTGALDSNLFLTGTSEGGFVTMATHRAMEALGTDEFKISATVATSGPYALADVTRQMIATNNGVPGYAWMQLQSYQRVYGDVYTKIEDVFEAPYVHQSGFRTLLPNPQSMATLTRGGRLPPMLEGPFGLGLLTHKFTQAYMNDPAQPARLHAQDNDLRSFVPKTPLSVCYGSLDEFAVFNAQAAMTWFQSQGASVGQVDIQNVDEYADFIQEMGGKKYHSFIEAPACEAWAREHAFDPIRHAGQAARY